MSTSVAHYENVTFKVNSRCFKLYRSYSISFNSWQNVLELNSIGLYQSSGKEKESCCLVFPALINEGGGEEPG